MSAQDNLLIAQFNARHNEDAFAALVKQHINLVFATALRQVGDGGAAEEIAQTVFVVLAQSCGKLGSHPTIAGWLYQTTLNKSREWLRSELRRRHREQVAVNLALAKAEGDSVWSPLVPLLDEALLKLSEPDRLSVILHYMEGRGFQEVGSVLGISEDGARKRVNRCLDELARFFRHRGFAVPAAASVAPLFALSSHAAPAGLAASATPAALAAAQSAASTSALTFVKGALKIMAWTKTKTAIVVGAGLLLASGTTTLIVFRHDIADNLTRAGGRRAIANHLAAPLDLTAHYTTPASYFDKITQYHVWKTVPRGFQVFDHVPLQIDGMFCLWGGRNAAGGLVFPEKVLGIEVNQKFESLYVYHGAFFPSRDNTPVCEVVFHYEDGSTATNQLLYGSDIVEWAARPGKKANTPTGPHAKTANDPTGPNSKAAWVGGTDVPGKNRPVRFCLTAIANPQPSIKVTSMDWFSCKSQTSACIMAMTTGRSGLMQ
jgi:RNA polymerase sigma factor (sigma-70 family)